MKEKILRFDDFGRGICYIDNKVTFVPFSVPDDIIEIEKTVEKKSFNEAKITKIIDSSSDRVIPPCPYFGTCGGCQYQMISYLKSLEVKYNNVVSYFKKNNLFINPSIIKNDNPFNYRNKITLKVVNSKIGYYKNNSHDIVEIDKCLLVSNKINEVIKYVGNINIINGEIIIRSSTSS